jgi:predicted transcriptional regulator
LQAQIEEFLKKNYPNTYLASEIADAVKISRSSALRQLKKLAAKGTVRRLEGRYGYVPPKPRPAPDTLEGMIDGLADLTGIPKPVIDDWAEEVKARRAGQG